MIQSYFTRSLTMMALAHLTIELCGNFLPVLYPLLIKNWGLTYTQIGGVVFVLTVAAALTQPVFGYLSDRWGARRIIILSVAWMGLVTGLVGLSGNYLTLLVLVALGALGSAAFHPAGASLSLVGMIDRRGTAMSIFSVGGTLGSALSPLLIAAGVGWLGLPGTAVLVPVALLVSLVIHLTLRGQPDSQPSRPATGPAAAPNLPRRLAAGGSRFALALIVVSAMCRSWHQVALMAYLPEWVHSQGYSLAFSGQMLSIMMVAVSLGSLVGGSLADRIGGWQVTVLSLVLLTPAHWLFLSAAGLWQMALIGVMGVMIGINFPVGLVMAQEAWPRGIGLASALVMGLGWAPGGLGASVTGLIADHISLAVGLQWLTLAPVLGLACIMVYPLVQRRPAPLASSDVV